MEHLLIPLLRLLRRRVLPTLALLTALPAVMLLCARAVGIVASDRFGWSQWLAWIPTAPAIVLAGILLLLSCLLAMLASRLAGLRLRAVGVALLVPMLAWHLGAELRLHRVVTGDPGPRRGETHDGAGRILRISFLNAAGSTVTPERLIAAGLPKSHVLITVNTLSIRDAEPWRPLLDDRRGGRFPPRGPDDPPPVALRRGPFNVVSVLPRYAAEVRLGVADRMLLPGTSREDRTISTLALRLGWNPDPEDAGDPGAASGAIDIPGDIGTWQGPTLWLLDLPSSPAVERRGVVDQVRGLLGPARGMDPADASWWHRPDLVLGDCNIPRGSASLSRLDDGLGVRLRDVREDVGIGLDATWPMTWRPWRRNGPTGPAVLGRELPPPALWAIDRALGSQRVVFLSHRVTRIPGLNHGAITVEVLVLPLHDSGPEGSERDGSGRDGPGRG